VFHANDPGGETKYGISKRSYPHLDIKNLSLTDAKAIYKKDFWDKCSLDEINWQHIADVIFDMAVNMGRKRAVKIAQKAYNSVSGDYITVDRLIGKNTIKAINSLVDERDMVNKMVDLRVDYYLSLIHRNSKFKVFKKGWLRRANSFRMEEQ
jgi:lysozyme family protein